MNISIWDYEKPLDAMMLSHDHIAMLVMKHEQQIKDLAAHLLELKQSMPTVKNSLTVQARLPLTDDQIKECSHDADGFMVSREKAMRAVERAHGIGEKE